jgi:peroxiredoxin Q/BCP
MDTITMPVEIGTKVPEFCLPDQDGTEVCTRDLLGFYSVIYFYPKDNSSGCTAEARDFSEIADYFSTLRVQVLGISPDSQISHKQFIDKKGLKIRLLSDSSHIVAEEFGSWVGKKLYGKEFMGVDRSTFIIGPDGNVLAVWRRVKVKGHVAKVRNSLEQIITPSP